MGTADGMTDTAVAAAGNVAGTSMTMTAVAPHNAVVSEMIGSTLAGRYLVTRKIGQGGMGAVYEATHTLIGKSVAVKVLLEKYAKREAIVQRLEMEAKLASSLRNEHIIDITDFGQTEDGRTFVVMELLTGESLADRLARDTTLPEQKILKIVAQAASALAAAHAKDVVHRDIKPENLFLLKDRKDEDFVKVVDFGISKSLRASDDENEQPRLTQTGMVLGTPLYMSPEQARGDETCDHRVDIYALGVIMYEAATGRVPFAGNNYLSVISQVLNEHPKPLRELRPELSEEFENIVLKAMEKDRRDRYASAAELQADLTLLIDDPTRSSERAKITGPRRRAGKAGLGSSTKIAIGVVSVTALIGVLALIVYGLNRDKPPATPAVAAEAGVAMKAPLDAVAPPPQADAAIPTITIHVETDPKDGVSLLRDGAEIGTAPQDVLFVLEPKDIKITASAVGYEDTTYTLNPVEQQDRKALKLKLKKLPPNTPQPPHNVTVPHAGSGSGAGSGSATPNKTGGELTGNPFGKKQP